MSLLPKGKENSHEVTWEDQQKINSFSSLIQQKDNLEEDLKACNKEQEYLNDVISDIELLELEDDDDDDLDSDLESDSGSGVDKSGKVQYKVGDCFVFMAYQEATERATKEKEKHDTMAERLEKEVSELEAKLSVLKSELYSKFGDSINLERD